MLSVPIAAACGSSDESKHQVVTPTVQGFAEALCQLAFKCCSPGEVGFYVGPFINAGNCVDRLMDATLVAPDTGLSIPAFYGLDVSIPNLGSLDRAIREDRTEIDAAALKDCIAYLGGLACNEPPKEDQQTKCQPLEPPADTTKCDPRKLFIGKLAEGDECTSSGASYECEPGLYCAKASKLGVFGQCISAGLAGDPCLEDFECDESKGLYCSLLDGTCQMPRLEGETCVYADHLDPSPSEETLLLKCREDLSCDPISHTCVVHCQQGAACGDDADCDEDKELKCITGRCDKPRKDGLPCATTDDCEEGLRCRPDEADPTKLLCRPREVDGSTCQEHTDCQSKFCDFNTYKCSPRVAPGGVCPTGQDEQCLDGACQGSNFGYCTADIDCYGGGRCNLILNECQSICVALLPDNAVCTLSSECVSQVCAGGFCREPPLEDGVQCDSDDQCKSKFCGLDTTRVCTKLPLPNGAPCYDDVQCDSLICIDIGGTGEKTCDAGLTEGDQCAGGTAIRRPCDRKTLYCDMTRDTPVCVTLHDTGEPCRPNNGECRGSCTLQHGRYLCDDTPKPDAAICDGK